jgi:hypothetical protein
LIEIGNGFFKLPLEEKKQLLCSCVFGIDIDIHAVEVAKFSLLIKLIENETTPSVAESTPILPELSTNIFHGNALIGEHELDGRKLTPREMFAVVPFNWSEMRLDSRLMPSSVTRLTSAQKIYTHCSLQLNLMSTKTNIVPHISSLTNTSSSSNAPSAG